MKRGSEMCWRKKRRKSHRRNAVKSVILKSKKYKNKKSREFWSQFQVQKEQRKKSSEKSTSGGVGRRGGLTWKNIPLLSECIFVSTQSWLGFGITCSTACFPWREQTVRLATEGLSVPISGRYSETWRVSQLDSLLWPSQQAATFCLSICITASSEGEACYISIAKNGLSVMIRYQLLLLIINGCLPLKALQFHIANHKMGKSAVWGIQNGDLLRLFKPNKALQWQPDLFIMMLFVSPVVFQHDLHQFPLYSLSTSVKENLTGQDFTKITAKWKK